MSFTEKKRDEIKKYILRKIARGDGAVLEKTMDSFGISITTVKRYIKEALDNGIIEYAAGAKESYRLIETEYRSNVSLEEGMPEEDVLLQQYIMPYLTGCNE